MQQTALEAREAKRMLLEIAALTVLLTAIDQLYRWLHPEVNLARAALVGLTAFAVLSAFARLCARPVPVLRGALAIFVSAVVSVLAIEAGWLVSRSLLSAAVHVVLLAGAWLALGADAQGAGGRCGGAPRTTESRDLSRDARRSG